MASHPPQPSPGSGQPLTNRTLQRHAARVSVPTYERARLTPSVVHIGVGGFHRAHQAVYFDELAERRVSSEWGVVGVGLRSAGMRAALAPQNGLYTVIQRGAGEDEARVIGALSRCLYAPEDPEAVVRLLADERTRLVTLTITGAGYDLDRSGRRFGRFHPPTSFSGYLVEALDRRRRAGVPPFTVLSCDNVPANGAVAQDAVTGFARLRDPWLAAWIEEHVAFPHSMVDRITPRTTPAVRRSLAHRFGVCDRWPVATEPFSQWIVEDAFCNDRPPLDEVGVQFVVDVEPYELTKKRLLNGTHCAMAYLGHLAGHRVTGEAMADPLFAGYVERLMEDEIAPLLPPVAGLDLAAYTRTVRRRLANPRIGDQLARLCGRGSTKMPAYLLPSLAEARAAGRPHALLTLAVAGWIRYLRGSDEQGRPIEIADAHAGRLRELAVIGGDDPRPVLRERWLFGELAGDEELATALTLSLRRLCDLGARGAIAESLSADLAEAA
jgi:mannitol 2-dehydrogenase